MLLYVFLSVSHVLSNSPLSALFPPPSDRAFVVLSRIPQFPSSIICLYNSVSLCISEAGLHTVFLISLLCSSFILYLPVPTCVCFGHFLMLMSSSITFVSFPPHLLALLPRYPPPPICCLHSFQFALVHLHSCSLPCHSLLLHFFSFCLFHPFFSHMHSSLTPLSACWDGNHTMPVRRGGGEVPFLHSIHTCGDMKEHCSAQKEKICGNIWHRHRNEGYLVALVHTNVTPEYSWG